VDEMVGVMSVFVLRVRRDRNRLRYFSPARHFSEHDHVFSPLPRSRQWFHDHGIFSSPSRLVPQASRVFSTVTSFPVTIHVHGTHSTD
jgi:hypothetical protein